MSSYIRTMRSVSHILQILVNFNKLLVFPKLLIKLIVNVFSFGDQDIRLYDKHINETHLRECLQSLLKRYDTIEDTRKTRFRPLFESIYLIQNLGTNEALLRYGSLPSEMKNHKMVFKSYKLGLNLLNGLYYQVIQSIAAIEVPILAALGATKIPEIHSMAIKKLCFGYSSPNTRFPIRILSQWLCPFEKNLKTADNYIEELSKNYGLNVINDSIAFNKTDFNETAKQVII